MEMPYTTNYGTAGNLKNNTRDPFFAFHSPLRTMPNLSGLHGNHAKEEISEIVDSATPDITNDLSASPNNFSAEYATNVIQKDLITAINAQQGDPAITFEAASGKL